MDKAEAKEEEEEEKLKRNTENMLHSRPILVYTCTHVSRKQK